MKNVIKIELISKNEYDSKYYVINIKKTEEMDFHLCKFISFLGFNKEDEMKIDISYEIEINALKVIQNKKYKIFIYVMKNSVIIITEIIKGDNKELKKAINEFFSFS